MPEPMIRVLLVDDHTIVRRGIRALLLQLPDIAVVGEAGDGAGGRALAEQLAPDVALVDLLMPGGLNGVVTTREIKRVSPATQVIVLTSYHTDEHIFPALRAGALSYVLKDASPEALVDAIRKARHGEAILSPRVAERVIRELDGELVRVGNPFAELTPRERGVLQLIAAGRSNAQIAGELVLSDYTIKGYVSAILGKLHVADRTQAAVLAWREGLQP
jgi:two-component system, NarL family, response regulator LiaR